MEEGRENKIMPEKQTFESSVWQNTFTMDLQE